MIVQALSSLKLTVPLMLALLVVSLVSYRVEAVSAWWLVGPLLLLAINLLSAISTNPKFRRQSGLLVFHICLLLTILLIAYGRLNAFEARVEITQGEKFDPTRVMVQGRGPWHSLEQLNAISFVQGPFEVEYGPGLMRGQTHSTIWYGGSENERRDVETFGDNVPFKAAGYRLYTTSNKGFALIISWIGKSDGRQTTALHLPSYPLYVWKQLKDWTTPSGDKVQFEFEPAQPISTNSSWTLDQSHAQGQLRVKTDAGKFTLQRGKSIQLKNGRIRFEEVRMWIGYELFYDFVLPWLLVTGLLGVMGLAWHFYGRIWTQPLDLKPAM